MGTPEIREVYSAADTQEAYLIKNVLADAGIEARVTEDPLLNAIGDLPASAIAPRIWVRAEDFDNAKVILLDRQAVWKADREKGSWKCTQCGELNEPSFDICWNCQVVRDDIGDESH